MEQSAKYFATKLNSCLDDTGVPNHARERAAVLSKTINIPKQQAWILLEGHQLPSHDLIQKIATEFEVDPEWLTGSK